MNATLASRLNQVLPRITEGALLSSEGIGNEIACYIFDYPARHELQVREYLQMMAKRLSTHHSELRVLHLNLLDVAVAYLEKRNLLAPTIAMQATKDDAAVLRALKGPFSAMRLRDFIGEQHSPSQHDLVLLSGVGSVWPLLRAHSLLNCLHTILGTTPLVMFYPGTFDGTTLRLFGRIAAPTSRVGVKPYYRAFILVPGGTEE